MEKGGKKLTVNSPKYGKSLISPLEEKEVKRKNINFSFSYFNQIDYFGIGSCSQQWFVGLIARFKELGNLTYEQLIGENRGSKSLRYHPIIWSIKHGPPIKRSNLFWLPKDILKNEEDFPLVQFSISKSQGRIVGFFSEDHYTFNIVLFDPNHNIQPSIKNNYQIQPTTIGISQYDDLLSSLNNIKLQISKCSNQCALSKIIDIIEQKHNVIYINLDKDFYEQYMKEIERFSLNSIIEKGIIGLMEEE